jgi:hypothetical protein
MDGRLAKTPAWNEQTGRLQMEGELRHPPCGFFI